MVGIVDADSAIWIACYPKREEDGSSTNKTVLTAAEAFDSLLKYVLEQANCDQYIGFISGGRSGRDVINPNYKQNRTGTILPDFYREIEEYAQRERGIIKYKNYEADDCVATVSKKLGEEGVIISIDKDLLNLPGKHFNFHYKHMKAGYVTPYQAEEYLWKSMITGDKADNIAGIPGKGEAFAKKLFSDIETFPTPAFAVLDSYLKHFGERKGMEEFYKNYMSLKVIDEIEGFEIPEPINLNTWL